MKVMSLSLLLCLLMTACNNSPENQPTEPSYAALKMFPEGKAFSGFQLTSHKSKPWTQENFKGNHSILFFGFVNCPDICPTTLLEMQKIDKMLKNNQVKSPNFVFISVDSDRDTPKILNDYINYFNPEFIALTGDAPNILSITSQLGVAYRIEEHQKGDLIYDVDHASALFVLNPEGERIGIFPAPHKVNDIAADIQQLMEKS
ncbi:SCO family protein [Marinicella litoralis]|uniref:Protein SCO1/2 n=2 Tax=Marinicella litoralis TaxID=644220 RepID=A0A4R6XVQ6_9GAMM|nr:SCO family protein [Marinicella litoralis]TDR22500.1 protein SCO1/2 [Marinicella litoralis]